MLCMSFLMAFQQVNSVAKWSNKKTKQPPQKNQEQKNKQPPPTPQKNKPSNC